MKFVLMFNESAEAIAKRTHPEDGPAYWAGWSAYMKELGESGVMLGGHALQPSETATTLRSNNGEHVVHDGPYAETKEMLGGFVSIDVASLDEALAWASRCPALDGGAVEIRPILTGM